MSKNFGQALIDIYVAPKQLFTTLQEKKGWSWGAFFLLLSVNIIGVWWFYHGMSSEWIVEQQLAQVSHSMTSAEIDQNRAVFEQMADKTGLFAAGGVLVITPIMLALMAVYLMLVGNRGQKRSYGSWYALSVWSNMPSILNILGLIVLILISSDPNLPLSTVNYLSINQLFLGLEPGDAWYTWTEAFNLIYLWISGLFAVGLHSWSGYSVRKSTLLAFLPFIVIFGLWALFV